MRLWDATTGAHKRTPGIALGHKRIVQMDCQSSWDGTALLWDIPSIPTQQVKGDVNGDGVVNIQDLVLVARFGQTGQNDADINGDGVVNILDLVLVAGAFANVPAAPSLHPQTLAMLTAADAERWLIQAQEMALTDPAYLRGIAMLEQLLSALTPKETVLLANYPNPFNPETWIPYHLARAANIQVTVYDAKGAISVGFGAVCGVLYRSVKSNYVTTRRKVGISINFGYHPDLSGREIILP